MNIIKNEFLEVSIKEIGAELCSLKLLEKNKEFIWQGDAKYWAKHSPVLFPIIGGIKNKEYIAQGNKYNLNNHGIAKDSEFEVVEKKSDKIKFLLKSSEETLKLYPYLFELYITYSLNNKKLKVKFEVKNIDNKEIYFSIGAHPGFNCAMQTDDIYLEFEQYEKLESIKVNDTNGLLEHEKVLVSDRCKFIKVNNELFEPLGTLIFDNIKSDFLILKNKNEENAVKVNIKGFPYLAFWTKKNPKAPFLCVEPWFGIPDFVDSNNILKEKVGGQKLSKGQIFECSYEIEII